MELAVEERIGVFYDGLKAMTVCGAYQYCEEDRKGTLKAGKLADLIVLDRDPAGRGERHPGAGDHQRGERGVQKPGHAVGGPSLSGRGRGLVAEKQNLQLFLKM